MNFLKMHVSEIRVKRIRVNQGLGVIEKDLISVLTQIFLDSCNVVENHV